jgi:hypothetical protein
VRVAIGFWSAAVVEAHLDFQAISGYLSDASQETAGQFRRTVTRFHGNKSRLD